MSNNLEKNKKINSSELKSTVKLFEQTSIFKSLSKVVFLAVLVSFVTGLYVFVDQVLMTKILPLNKQGFLEDTLDKVKWYELINSDFNNESGILDNYLDPHSVVTSIIRVSNSANSPIIILCTAIALTISLGTSIPYSRALGSKDINKINKIWKNGFYNNIFFSILTTLILIGLIYIIIPSQITSEIPANSNIKIQEFFNLKSQLSIEYATQYALIIVGFNILNNFSLFFISLLNSEGKNFIPTLFVIIANLFNILFDYIFLYYSNLGMNGSAVATIISFIISNTGFIIYLILKNKKNDTFLIFKNLNIKKFEVDWKIIALIFAIGSASFFRNFATAIFSLSQQSIYANITSEITGHTSTYYIDLLGAITPIYNLFYSAIIGIIRGARTVVSYNYGLNNQKNVINSFWIINGMTLFYGFMFFIIVCPLLTSFPFFNGGLLYFFDITWDSPLFNDAVELLYITISQLIVFCLSVSGMLYFQSTEQPIRALIVSITNGLLLGIPSLFIFSLISQKIHNITIFLYSPIIITSISGIIIFLYTTWFIYNKRKSKDIIHKEVKKSENY